MGNEMQGVVPLRICDVGICAMCDEELNDINVSVASGPLHGSSNEVTTESVDLRALFEEVSACRKLRVDGCPVKRGDVLRVSVGRRGSTGFDEVSDDVYFSALRSDEDVYLKEWVSRQSRVDKRAEGLPRDCESSGLES